MPRLQGHIAPGDPVGMAALLGIGAQRRGTQGLGHWGGVGVGGRLVALWGITGGTRVWGHWVARRNWWILK